MSKPVNDIRISEDDPKVALAIEAGLTMSLSNAMPQAENTCFVLSARDPRNALVGGLTAGASYGWLLIKALWVEDAHRGHGLGRSLVERAEHKAWAIACHGAWLDTSSPDAVQFYTRLGYEPFGQLVNSTGQNPAAHCRWFMKKQL